MAGSVIEYEFNCSYGISPQPFSENNASEMALGSVSIFKSTVEADNSFSSGFGASATVPLESEGVKTTSHLLHDPSSLSFDMFGSGNFSEMVGSFGFVTEGHQSQIATIKCPFSYVPNLDAGSSEEERVSTKNDAKTRLDCANEKRRKLALGSNSSSSNKNAVEPIENVSEILKKDDKTLKVEHRMCANYNTKSDGKQAKGGSQSVQAPKENYVHVRARRGRGRATNSHSLAERVRREKISERMKLLQDLVPGCNQITGKTVVLDEIISYVQSLQQQVEFLSMKLADVGPESNLDTEEILLRNILRAQGENVDGVLAINPRLTTSHTTHQATFQLHGTIPTMPRTSQKLCSLSKTKR